MLTRNRFNKISKAIIKYDVAKNDLSEMYLKFTCEIFIELSKSKYGLMNILEIKSQTSLNQG
jgi:hypothetical protein